MNHGDNMNQPMQDDDATPVETPDEVSEAAARLGRRSAINRANTTNVSVETRLRAGLSMITRASRLLDDARQMESIASIEMGDARLTQACRDHVATCEALLSDVMKRVGKLTAA